MKAEINDLNKVRFFAQYWGQKVFVNPVLDPNPVPNCWIFDHTNPEDIDEEYLLLKDAEKCSDEHLKSIALCVFDQYTDANKMIYTDQDLIDMGRYLLGFHFTGEGLDDIDEMGVFEAGEIEELNYELVFIADKLRGWGYLIDFEGLGVKEIIEAGWGRYEGKEICDE